MGAKPMSTDLAALSEAAAQERADREYYLDGRAVPLAMAVARFHAALEAAYRSGHLIHIPDEAAAVERVAWRMWKAEADRAAPNVGRNRTLDAFRNASPDERERWLGLATAALAALKEKG